MGLTRNDAAFGWGWYNFDLNSIPDLIPNYRGTQPRSQKRNSGRGS